MANTRTGLTLDDLLSAQRDLAQKGDAQAERTIDRLVELKNTIKQQTEGVTKHAKEQTAVLSHMDKTEAKSNTLKSIEKLSVQERLLDVANLVEEKKIDKEEAEIIALLKKGLIDKNGNGLNANVLRMSITLDKVVKGLTGVGKTQQEAKKESEGKAEQTKEEHTEEKKQKPKGFIKSTADAVRATANAISKPVAVLRDATNLADHLTRVKDTTKVSKAAIGSEEFRNSVAKMSEKLNLATKQGSPSAKVRKGAFEGAEKLFFGNVKQHNQNDPVQKVYNDIKTAAKSQDFTKLQGILTKANEDFKEKRVVVPDRYKTSKVLARGGAIGYTGALLSKYSSKLGKPLDATVGKVGKAIGSGIVNLSEKYVKTGNAFAQKLEDFSGKTDNKFGKYFAQKSANVAKRVTAIEGEKLEKLGTNITGASTGISRKIKKLGHGMMMLVEPSVATERYGNVVNKIKSVGERAGKKIEEMGANIPAPVKAAAAQLKNTLSGLFGTPPKNDTEKKSEEEAENKEPVLLKEIADNTAAIKEKIGDHTTQVTDNTVAPEVVTKAEAVTLPQKDAPVDKPSIIAKQTADKKKSDPILVKASDTSKAPVSQDASSIEALMEQNKKIDDQTNLLQQIVANTASLSKPEEPKKDTAKATPAKASESGGGIVSDILDNIPGKGKIGNILKSGAKSMGKLGKFLGTAKGAIKGSGIIAGAMGAYDAYSGWSDASANESDQKAAIDAKVNSGEISATEAKALKADVSDKADVAKGTAVGTGAGEAIGGVGGAMLGSLLGPAGTIAGGWLGSKVGGAVGGVVGEYGTKAYKGVKDFFGAGDSISPQNLKVSAPTPKVADALANQTVENAEARRQQTIPTTQNTVVSAPQTNINNTSTTSIKSPVRNTEGTLQNYMKSRYAF